MTIEDVVNRIFDFQRGRDRNSDDHHAHDSHGHEDRGYEDRYFFRGREGREYDHHRDDYPYFFRRRDIDNSRYRAASGFKEEVIYIGDLTVDSIISGTDVSVKNYLGDVVDYAIYPDGGFKVRNLNARCQQGVTTICRDWIDVFRVNYYKGDIRERIFCFFDLKKEIGVTRVYLRLCYYPGVTSVVDYRLNISLISVDSKLVDGLRAFLEKDAHNPKPQF